MIKQEPPPTLVTEPPEWLSNPTGAIILCVAITAHRNLEGKLFPHKLDLKGAKEVGRFMAPAMQALFSLGEGVGPAYVCRRSNLSEDQVTCLQERMLIDESFGTIPKSIQAGSSVILRESPTISLAVNDDDHWQLKLVNRGFNRYLIHSLNHIMKVAEQHVAFADQPPFGVLTSSPALMGSGIKVKVLVHIPALTAMNRQTIVLHSINQREVECEALGVDMVNMQSSSMRPFIGNLVILTNRNNRRRTKEETVEHVFEVARQVEVAENQSRAELQGAHNIRLKDLVGRAAGLVKGARIISTEEAMTALSFIRLGVDTGVIKTRSIEEINAVQFAILPGHFRMRHQGSPHDENVLRAKILRKAFA